MRTVTPQHVVRTEPGFELADLIRRLRDLESRVERASSPASDNVASGDVVSIEVSPTDPDRVRIITRTAASAGVLRVAASTLVNINPATPDRLTLPSLGPRTA